MARATYASFDKKSNQKNILAAICSALATLASGKNADATDYTLPVSHQPSTATPVAAGTGDAAAVAAAANLRLLGFTVRESAGTPALATLYVRNGADATGAIVAVAALQASEGKTFWFGPGGIDCAAGVFVDRLTGNSEIVVYTKVVT